MKQPKIKTIKKVCFTCKKRKPVSKFYSNKAKTTGLYGSCIVCVKKRIKYPKSKDNKIIYLKHQLKKEVWEDVIINEELFPYKISDCGRVLIVRMSKIGKPSFDSRGYPQIVLSKNRKRIGRRIHILVGNAFIPNPENLREINHKDGNKLYPHRSNLERATSKENTRHAFDIGIKKPFTTINHPLSRKVININTKRIYPSIRTAANKTGINYGSLGKKLSGKSFNDTNLKYA